MSIEYEFDLHLDDVDAAVHALFPVALAKGMEHVRAVAAELTPIWTGNLVGSAAVTVGDDEAQLTYPGPYARNQHYTLSFHHNHGQALYLEQPMITEAGPVVQIISDTLGEAF